MALTKTSFMRGMQCPKMLWLDKHKPGLKIIPPEVQARLDAGSDFGELAKGMFGQYEDMSVFCKDGKVPNTKAMIANTIDALGRGVEVICEAAFSNYNNYCAADILRKNGAGYDLYEVKNSATVDEQHIKDAGFQYYIISRCKVKIGKIYIVTHGEDEEKPFVPVDVTKRAKGYYKWINDHIWDLNRRQKETDEIEMETGIQCSEPYECWYYAYCHGGTSSESADEG